MALTGVIPIQSGGPSGPLGGAPPVQAPNIAPGLDALGRAGMQYAERQREQDDRDAVANAHMQVSQAATDLAAWQNDLQDKTPDDPTGYTPKVASAVDDYAQKLVAMQTNPVAKDVAMRSMAALRTSQIDSAIHWEATQKVKYRVDQVDKITDNYSQYLVHNHDDFDVVAAGVDSAIDGMNLEPGVREKLKSGAADKLVMAANRGFLINNPRLAQSVYNKRAGITEDDLPANAAPPGQIGAPGAQAPADGSAQPGGFDAAYTRIQRIERGTVANDAGAGLTVNGINQAANPDLDVANLTPDQQRGVYKERYWDAIGADKLAPAAAQFAFDTAVNQGVGFAKRMLEATGGDMQQMLAARLARYRQTAQDPAKAGNLAGWTARATTLATELAGQAPQTPTQVAQAQASTMVDVDPALPVETLPAMNVSAKINVSFLDRLNGQQLIQLKTEADALVRKDQSEAQAEVRGLYHNAASQAEHGVIPPMPDQALMLRAFGPGKAAQQAANFDALRTQATAAAGASTMTTDQLDAQWQKLLPPSVDDPDWAQKQKAADAFQKARNAIVTARDKDPIGAAADQGIGTTAPLDFSNPASFAAELKNRQAIARTMHDKYGAASYSPFTKDEASAIAENFHTLAPSSALAFLSSMRSNLQDDHVYQAGIDVMGKKSPPIQAAAVYAGMGPLAAQPDGTTAHQVALTVLEGDRLLAPDKYAKAEGAAKYTLPPTGGSAGMDQYVGAKLGPAFMADADSFARAKQSVYAYYAADSAAKGIYNEAAYDSTRLDHAVDMVVGQRSKWATNFFGGGGQPVIMPWGTKEQDFRRNLQQSYAASMTAAGLTKTTLDNPRQLDLVRVDEYHYGLRAGGNVLIGKQGLPVILDVNPTPDTP